MYNLKNTRKGKSSNLPITKEGEAFNTKSHGIKLYDKSNGEHVLEVDEASQFYINGNPLGVAGMPPSKHAYTHAIGGIDELTPVAIGALSNSDLTLVPSPGKIPKLDNNGFLNPDFLEGGIDTKAHAETHYTDGSDPLDIERLGGVSTTDSRLSDNRTPRNHKLTHYIGGSDELDIAQMGGVKTDDPRLEDDRNPLVHAETHNYKTGSDPINWADVGSVEEAMFTVSERKPNGYVQLTELGQIDKNLLPTESFEVNAHAESHGKNGSDRITIDASQIISGTIALARIPNTAISEIVNVENDLERFQLTLKQVQKNDIVHVIDTDLFFFVVDDSQLNNEAGYKPITVATVDWSKITNVPTEFNPMKHASTHRKGGSDEITADMLEVVSNETFYAFKDTIETNLAGKADLNHADVATKYGATTSTKYGHVKSSDTITNNTEASLVPSMKCIYDLKLLLQEEISEAVSGSEDLEALKQQVASNTSQIVTNASQIGTNTNTNNSQQIQIDSNTAEIEALKNKGSDDEQAFSDLEELVKQLQTTVNAYNTRITELEDSVIKSDTVSRMEVDENGTGSDNYFIQPTARN